jgi:caffeoyl-CoA O-methyltransferase
MDLSEYAARHTTAAPPQLQALEAETRERLALPQMLSGLVVGRLLETLVHVMQPRLVLEIGTFSGGSALWMAGALTSGARLVTCEIDLEHAAFAERHVAAAALDDRVEIVVGPALETIASLPGPYDLVFLDADKTGYLDYYEAVVPKLAQGGLLVADNTLRGGEVLDPRHDDPGTRAIVAFNERVVADSRVVATQLTVRDGVTLIRLA